MWEVYGDIIINNIKQNIDLNTIMCSECGKRFKPNNNKQKYCEECAKEIDRMKAKNRMKKIRSSK